MSTRERGQPTVPSSRAIQITLTHAAAGAAGQLRAAGRARVLTMNATRRGDEMLETSTSW